MDIHVEHVALWVNAGDGLPILVPSVDADILKTLTTCPRRGPIDEQERDTAVHACPFPRFSFCDSPCKNSYATGTAKALIAKLSTMVSNSP
jgi:hypothetical protein